VFIIVGLLLLILAGLAAYLMGRTETAPTAPTQQQEAAVEDIKARMQSFVDGCVRTILAPLVYEMGLRGATLNPRTDKGTVFATLTRKEVDTWCVEVTAEKTCTNRARTREIVEKEMNVELARRLPACLQTIGRALPGGKVVPESKPLKVLTTLEGEDIIVRLTFEGTASLREARVDFEEFIARTPIPFGRLVQIGLDITNAEARQGFFDKEAYILRQGGDIIIQKARPYPDIIYTVSTQVAGYSIPLTLIFGVKGRDTANIELRKALSSLGCCVSPSTDCRSNIEQSVCTAEGGAYTAGAACRCQTLSKPVVQGCCARSDNTCSFAVNALDCNGTYAPNDRSCSGAIANGNCSNLWCSDTLYYQSKYFGEKQHGESWCTYDTVTGFGTDFVGNRHYVHSCINGKEYVEPCRDYREEHCVEGKDPKTKFNRATCKLNRWYDCAGGGGCMDVENRECFNLNLISSAITNKAHIACVPFVPPGFKFWLGQNRAACNVGNARVHRKYPRTQGFNLLHICSRLGDCSDKRNWVGVLAKGGYYNPKGRPKQKHYDAYSLAGYHNPIGTSEDQPYHYLRRYKKQRTLYPWLSGLTYETSFSRNVGATSIASGGGGQVQCKPWVAPSDYSRCQLCNLDWNRPCTEYRCEALGSSCRWIFSKGVGTCQGPASGGADLIGPVVTLDQDSVKDFIVTSEPGTTTHVKYGFQPPAPGSTAVLFNLLTSEPARCFGALAPPGVELPDSELQVDVPDALTVPGETAEDHFVSFFEIPVGTGDYMTVHPVAFITPPKELMPAVGFVSNNATLYFSCDDEFGNPGKNILSVRIPLNDSAETVDVKPPKVMSAERIDATGFPAAFRASFDEPIEQCRVGGEGQSFDQMALLDGCAPGAFDYAIVDWAPLGAKVCELTLDDALKDITHISCKDLAGNINEPSPITIRTVEATEGETPQDFFVDVPEDEGDGGADGDGFDEGAQIA